VQSVLRLTSRKGSPLIEKVIRKIDQKVPETYACLSRSFTNRNVILFLVETICSLSYLHSVARRADTHNRREHDGKVTYL